MAEPTLKDVLNAITKLTDRVDKIDAKVERLDAKIDAKVDALADDVAAHRAETAAHRKETAKGFDDLDDELAKHSERTHRKLEARVERLEKQARPAKVTARMPRRR